MRTPAAERRCEDAPATATPRKITDRLEPGGASRRRGAGDTRASRTASAAAAAAVAQKVVLYEEDPADPQGKRFVGSAIWRTEHDLARARPAARARDPRRRRNSRPQARDDLVASPQHRPVAAGEPHGRDHVPAAAGLPVRRRLQCARHPDEAVRADPRRAACRACGQGHQRLLPDRAVVRPTPTASAMSQMLKERPGSTFRSSTTTTAAPSWRSRRARRASACSPKPSRSGSSKRVRHAPLFDGRASTDTPHLVLAITGYSRRSSSRFRGAPRATPSWTISPVYSRWLRCAMRF